MEKLQNTSYWKNSPDIKSNHTIYASREDAVADNDPDDLIPDSSRKPYGIMLENGSVLDSELSITTNNPVYVKGDFNKHQTSNGSSLINKNNELDGFGDENIDTWKPASIISDSTTLLSNSWNENNYQSGNPKTNASNTQFNFTMITGNVGTNRSKSQTGGGTYSGGLENFPRFLENWGGKDAIIRGSFIQLWKSKYASGRWGTTGKYNAPNRYWGFDDSYSKRNLPPSFTDLFPSTTDYITSSNWKIVNSNDSDLKKIFDKVICKHPDRKDIYKAKNIIDDNYTVSNEICEKLISDSSLELPLE